jgi:hypothetical protein
MTDDIHKFEIRSYGHGIFVLADGVRIARRGDPGTPQARTWVSLVRGWTVTSDDDEIVITHDGVQIH